MCSVFFAYALTFYSLYLDTEIPPIMKKSFLSTFIKSAFVAVIIPFAFSAQANEALKDINNMKTISISEGKDYTVIANPINTTSGDKIEVREFFWYGCGHCYSFEPDLIRWQNNMPADANYIPTPAPLGGWEIHARLYYALAALNKIDETHAKIFDAIHKDGNRLSNEASITDFLNANGIDAELVIATMDSFAVSSQITNAYNAFKDAQLNGVPSIVVNGKYVTSPSQAGSNARTIDVINALVKKSVNE